MDEDAPPLKVWAYCALLVVTVLSLFLFYTYSAYGPYAKVIEKSHGSLESALIKNNASDTSAISIVILGSSLTERALVDVHEMEDSLANQLKRKVRVLRIAVYYMNMDLAERMDFFAYIIKYPPQYLFIENFAINLDDNDSTMKVPVPVDAALLDLRNRLRKVIGLIPHENYYNRWYTFDAKPLPEHEFYTNKFDSLTFKSLQNKINIVRKIPQNDNANIAYEELKKKGTTVVFLDMPQSDKLQANFLDESATAELNGLLAFYRDHYNIDYWKYPVMHDSCFMDGAHLNYHGAKQYQHWFVSKLSSTK